MLLLSGLVINIGQVCHTRHPIIPMPGVDINDMQICHTRHPVIPVSGVALNLRRRKYVMPDTQLFPCPVKILRPDTQCLKHLVSRDK